MRFFAILVSGATTCAAMLENESVDYLLGRFLARNPGSERTLLLLVLSTTPVQPLTFFNDPRRFTFVVCFSAKQAARCLEDSFELKYGYTGACSLLGCMHARLIVKHWLIVKHSGILPQPVSRLRYVALCARQPRRVLPSPVQLVLRQPDVGRLYAEVIKWKI